MPVTSINKDAFLVAVQELTDCGEKVTQSSIRKRLGNKGSFTTINDWLKEWRQQHESTLTQAASLPMIPDKIKVAMNQLWRSAVDEGKSQYQQAVKEYQEKRDELAKEKHHLLSEIKRLQERVDGQQDGLKSFSKELNEAKAELKAAQTLAEERSTQLNKLQIEVETLRQTLQTEQQKSQTFAQELQIAHRQTDQQLQRHTNFETQNNQLKTDLEISLSEKRELILKLEQQRLQLEQLTNTNKTLNEETKHLSKENKHYQKEQHKDQLEVTRLTERLNAAQQQYDILRTEKNNTINQMQQQMQHSLSEIVKSSNPTKSRKKTN